MTETMTATMTAIVLFLLSGMASAAGTAASLAPAPARDARVWPYRAAELSVSNQSGRIARAVSLRWVGGGPTMIYPATIPPQSGRTILVSLPAVAAEQWYHVRLLAEDRADAERLAESEAAVTWPPQSATTDADNEFGQAFIDPDACDEYAFDVPHWPARARANVLIAAAIAAMAMAAVLFVRHRGARMVLLVVVAVAAAAVIYKAVLPHNTIVVRTLGGAELPIYAATPDDSLYVVAVRRTTRWAHPDARLAPIYYSKRHMAEDTTVVHADRGISASLRPGDVRLFRLRR